MVQPDLSSKKPVQGRWLLILTIAACVGVEGSLQLANHLELSPRLRATFYEYGGFWVGLLHHWQPNYTAQPYAMFLSYGFLHSGPVHLVVNMVTLWSLGYAVLARVGVAGFSLLYLGTMIGGAAGYALLASGPSLMVGASGALFGLAGGLLAWDFIDRRADRDSLRPVLATLAILVGLNVVLWWVLAGQLAWQTHLGGLVAGGILAPLIDRHPRML
ncbi:MAG: rhomboid family intramembrane serine protease [Roseobacter sp.]